MPEYTNTGDWHNQSWLRFEADPSGYLEELQRIASTMRAYPDLETNLIDYLAAQMMLPMEIYNPPLSAIRYSSLQIEFRPLVIPCHFIGIDYLDEPAKQEPEEPITLDQLRNS